MALVGRSHLRMILKAGRNGEAGYNVEDTFFARIDLYGIAITKAARSLWGIRA